MTAELREIILNIKDKTERLNAAYKNEKRKNFELNEKIKELKNENDNLREKLENLTNELETIKLTKALNNEEGDSETKGQINTLIREIDNCIALINKI